MRTILTGCILAGATLFAMSEFEHQPAAEPATEAATPGPTVEVREVEVVRETPVEWTTQEVDGRLQACPADKSSAAYRGWYEATMQARETNKQTLFSPGTGRGSFSPRASGG